MTGPLVSFSGEKTWDEKWPSLLTSALSTLHPSTRYLWLVLLLVCFVAFYYHFFHVDQAEESRRLHNIQDNMANGLTTNGRPRDTSRDFKGDVKVNNNPPTKEHLEKVADLMVLDVNRKSYTFKSLYADNENGPRKVLVVFIRHFFCGNCQEYLRILASSIPPSSLSTLTPPTSIIVIGCGQPELIPMYTKATDCPFPIYADPTRKLYDMLGMTKTLSLGPQAPEYMQRSIFSMAFSSFLQELRSGRKMLSGGDYRQVGGEFVFSGDKVTFCKRMKNTRDHAEIPDVRKALGLDRPVVDGDRNDEEKPSTTKRWSTSGLGAGLGRRLSNRRRSWAPVARSGSSKTREGKGSPPPGQGLQGLKEEEGGNVNGSATPEDALAKLEGKSPAREEPAKNGALANGSAGGITSEVAQEKSINETLANGTANDTTVPDVIDEKKDMANGVPVKGSTDGITNETPNTHVMA